MDSSEMVQQQSNDQAKKELIKVSANPYYSAKSPQDDTIMFESRFESGNLAAALKVNSQEYLLLL